MLFTCSFRRRNFVVVQQKSFKSANTNFRSRLILDVRSDSVFPIDCDQLVVPEGFFFFCRGRGWGWGWGALALSLSLSLSQTLDKISAQPRRQEMRQEEVLAQLNEESFREWGIWLGQLPPQLLGSIFPSFGFTWEGEREMVCGNDRMASFQHKTSRTESNNEIMIRFLQSKEDEEEKKESYFSHAPTKHERAEQMRAGISFSFFWSSTAGTSRRPSQPRGVGDIAGTFLRCCIEAMWTLPIFSTPFLPSFVRSFEVQETAAAVLFTLSISLVCLFFSCWTHSVPIVFECWHSTPKLDTHTYEAKDLSGEFISLSKTLE